MPTVSARVSARAQRVMRGFARRSLISSTQNGAHLEVDFGWLKR